MINTDDCTATEFIQEIIEQMEEKQTPVVAFPIDFADGTLYMKMELVPEDELYGEGDYPELTSTRTLQ